MVTAPGSSSPGPGDLGRTLADLRRRIETATSSGGELSAAPPQALETAYEELRVADEEIRCQQNQIDALLSEHNRTDVRQARLATGLPIPVVATDGLGGIRFANRAAADLLGVPLHRLTGKPLLAYIAVGSRSEMRSALHDLVRGRATQHRRRITLTARAGVVHEVDAYGCREPDSALSSVTWAFTPSVDGSDHLPEALLELTRLSSRAEGPEDLLRAAVRVCGSALGEEVATTLTLGDAGAPEATASTSKLGQAVEGAQMVAGEGPCATAIESAAVVVSDSLPGDDRWPALVHRLDGLDVGGAVVTPLVVDDVVVGVLAVYTRSGRPPSPTVTRACRLLAATVSSVLHEVRLRSELSATADGLRTALASRATIEQAKGIVMADKRCTADEAFRFLVDLSSSRNRKLRDVAAAIVERASGSS